MFNRIASLSPFVDRYQDYTDFESFDLEIHYTPDGAISGFNLQYGDDLLIFKNNKYKYNKIDQSRGPGGMPATELLMNESDPFPKDKFIEKFVKVSSTLPIGIKNLVSYKLNMFKESKI